MQFRQICVPAILIVGLALSGCASPYHTDRGAVFGGLMGAGLGTVVGAATGEPLAGAAIGGVAGTMTGAVVGGAMDNMEARNQAAIAAAQRGRRPPATAVSIADVVAMTQSGVQETVIATHVRNHGLARPLTTNDIIYLQRSGVSPNVIQAMQTSPPPVAIAGPPSPGPTYIASPPPPVVIVEPHHPHHPPFHHHWDHHPHHPGPGFSWGVSVSSDDF